MLGIPLRRPLRKRDVVSPKSLPSVNVLDCGATLNGVADDTAALYVAESRLPAYGGRILIPWGSLRTTASYIPQKPNITIVSGAARNAQNASVLGTQADGPGMIFADFAGPAITLDSQYNINGFGLQDVTLVGNRVAGGRAVLFRTSTTDFRREFLFDAVTMTRFDIAIATDLANGYPTGNDKSWGVLRVHNSQFTNNRWISKNLNGGQWQSFIFANNDAGQNGYQVNEGGLSLAAHNLSIVDNILEGQRDPIILTSGAYRSVVIRNNYFESNVGSACIDVASTYAIDIGPNFYATPTTDFLVRLRHVGYGRCLDPAAVTNGYYLDLLPAANSTVTTIKVPTATTTPVVWATFSAPKLDRSWDAVTSTTITPSTPVVIGGAPALAYRQTIPVGGLGSVAQSATLAGASGQWVVGQALVRKNSSHSSDFKWSMKINGSTSNAVGSLESVAGLSRHFLKRSEWVHVVVAARAHAAVTSAELVLFPYGESPTHTSDVTADMTRVEFTVVDDISNIVVGVAPPNAALNGSIVVDPSTLTNVNGRAATTVTVPGAALGDHVTSASFSQNLNGLELRSYVSSANTVTVEFVNNTGAAIDVTSGTLRVIVTKAV